jgi:hypothetical protein
MPPPLSSTMRWGGLTEVADPSGVPRSDRAAKGQGEWTGFPLHGLEPDENPAARLLGQARAGEALARIAFLRAALKRLRAERDRKQTLYVEGYTTLEETRTRLDRLARKRQDLG